MRVQSNEKHSKSFSIEWRNHISQSEQGKLSKLLEARKMLVSRAWFQFRIWLVEKLGRVF